MRIEPRYSAEGAIPTPTGGGGSGMVTRHGGGGTEEQVNRSLQAMSDRYRADAAGLAFMQSNPTAGNQGSAKTQVVITPSNTQNRQDSYGRPWGQMTGPRTVSKSRGYSVGGGGGAGVILDKPLEKPVFQTTPYPDVPSYVAPEYAPPEEDAGYERGKRQELVGNQAAQLRQATAEQMLANRSADNPAMRRQLARETVKGYGQALGQIYDTSARTAMQAAGQKRREDMAIYNAKYSAMTDEAKTNYMNEVNALVQNWMQDTQAARDDYALDVANYKAQPLAQRVGQETPTPKYMRVGYGLRLV